jgi:hypothetical protein
MAQQQLRHCPPGTKLVQTCKKSSTKSRSKSKSTSKSRDQNQKIKEDIRKYIQENRPAEKHIETGDPRMDQLILAVDAIPRIMPELVKLMKSRTIKAAHPADIHGRYKAAMDQLDVKPAFLRRSAVLKHGVFTLLL